MNTLQPGEGLPAKVQRVDLHQGVDMDREKVSLIAAEVL